jgi:hypothetical protein
MSKCLGFGVPGNATELFVNFSWKLVTAIYSFTQRQAVGFSETTVNTLQNARHNESPQS